MVLRLADMKKSVRARSDGERYVHPKLLEGESPGAQIALALAYFDARLGRPRRDLDPEVVLRCFGDPALARGVVTCLTATYRWRSLTFADVLDQKAIAYLAGLHIHTPMDLRLYLYDALNRTGDGYLPGERDAHLQPLARRLRLGTAKVDQLIALDAEEHAALIRVGATPEPAQMVRAYNFAAVDALLRNSRRISVPVREARARAALEAACRAHGVMLTEEHGELHLHGQADAFGSYARYGSHLTRALYTAAATTPDLLRNGTARVQLPGRTALYAFDRKTVSALTGSSGRVRCGAGMMRLREDWNGVRETSGTVGWRLITQPEPLISSAGLAVAPAACRRDDLVVLLWPVDAPSALDDVAALSQAGINVLGVARQSLLQVPDGVALVEAERGAEALIAALNDHWGDPRPAAGEQALESVLTELEQSGFLDEAHLMAALGCADQRELEARMRRIDAERGTFIAGLGLCSPQFTEAMRKGLRRKGRRSPAA